MRNYYYFSDNKNKREDVLPANKYKYSLKIEALEGPKFDKLYHDMCCFAYYGRVCRVFIRVVAGKFEKYFLKDNYLVYTSAQLRQSLREDILLHYSVSSDIIFSLETKSFDNKKNEDGKKEFPASAEVIIEYYSNTELTPVPFSEENLVLFAKIDLDRKYRLAKLLSEGGLPVLLQAATNYAPVLKSEFYKGLTLLSPINEKITDDTFKPRDRLPTVTQITIVKKGSRLKLKTIYLRHMIHNRGFLFFKKI